MSVKDKLSIGFLICQNASVSHGHKAKNTNDMIHEYAYYYIQVADYNRILYLIQKIQFNSMKAAKYLEYAI